MVIGRGRRREHPNQHCVLLLRKKNWEKKRRGKNTGIKSTGKKVREKGTKKKLEKK